MESSKRAQPRTKEVPSQSRPGPPGHVNFTLDRGAGQLSTRYEMGHGEAGNLNAGQARGDRPSGSSSATPPGWGGGALRPPSGPARHLPGAAARPSPPGPLPALPGNTAVPSGHGEADLCRVPAVWTHHPRLSTPPRKTPFYTILLTTGGITEGHQTPEGRKGRQTT